MPALKFIPFQIPTLVDAPPAGDGWVHEIKHDGYRTELIVERQSSCLQLGRGSSAAAELLAELPCWPSDSQLT